MSTHTVEIGDGNGKSFKISVAMDFRYRNGGTWRTLDKGFIRFNSGQVESVDVTGWGGTVHIRLVSSEGSWGIQLDNYQDFWGVNDDGTGSVSQAWVLGLAPGRISWVIV